MLISRAVAWLTVIVLSVLGTASLAKAQTPRGSLATLTIPQARQVAVIALRDQNPRLALQIAHGLIQRDPKDAFAHYVIAQAAHQLGAIREGRQAAARAFRFATSQQDKFATSQLAARLSYEEKRLTLAQIWLRRSVNAVQTPQQRQQLVKDFQRLRAENPWNTQLRFSVAPSSNVNSGSDSEISIIDGVPFVGQLSRDAQALSGVIGIADVSTSYRFSQSAKHSTSLTGRFYSRQVSLSATSKREAPDVRSRDFSATAVEFGLKHAFRIGQRKSRSTIHAVFGENWYGGEPLYTYAKLGYEHGFRISKQTALSFSGTYEHQNPEKDGRKSTNIARIQGRFRHSMENGDSIGIGFFANKTTSENVNSTSNSLTAHLSYSMGNPIGPAKVSLGIGATYLDYPSYSVGFIRVPDGRQDTRLFANAVFTFEKLDYAGFVPTVTLRAQKSSSNISRFDTSQLSVSIGIRSSF